MLSDIARLKRMRWSELEREALNVGVPLRVVDEAATLDELRLEILKKLNPEVEVASGCMGSQVGGAA